MVCICTLGQREDERERLRISKGVGEGVLTARERRKGDKERESVCVSELIWNSFLRNRFELLAPSAEGTEISYSTCLCRSPALSIEISYSTCLCRSPALSIEIWHRRNDTPNATGSTCLRFLSHLSSICWHQNRFSLLQKYFQRFI